MGVKRWLRKLTASSDTVAVLDAIDGAVPSTIEDLPEDTTARIVGRVEPVDDRRLTAPISQREVLCWGYEISSFDVMDRRSERLPFVLVEGSHRAIVDPEHARLLIAGSAFRKCRGVSTADDTLRPLLVRAGATDPPISWIHHSGKRSGPSTYRFAEWVIVPGMILAVVGRGVREVARAGAGYRGTETLLRLSGSPEHPMAITDEPA